MIASFTNRFIFIKTRKTAGTSVEVALGAWCAPPDVCTPFYFPPDERTRRTAGGLPGIELFRGHRVYNHMPADEVRRAFPDLWEQAFKFAVERHPYEKVVSRAYSNIGLHGGNPSADFSSELERVIANAKFVDRSLYLIDGRVVVDEVILYDNLWPRLAELGRSLGKSLPDPLPRSKGSFRLDRRPAREILSEGQKARIRQLAAFEFETFGFQP